MYYFLVNISCVSLLVVLETIFLNVFVNGMHLSIFMKNSISSINVLYIFVLRCLQNFRVITNNYRTDRKTNISSLVHIYIIVFLFLQSFSELATLRFSNEPNMFSVDLITVLTLCGRMVSQVGYATLLTTAFSVVAQS